MSFLLVIFLCIIQSSAKNLILRSMFLQAPFTYNRLDLHYSIAIHLSLTWLPWIVALLLWPFMYDLQRIPFSNWLHSNQRQPVLKQPIMKNWNKCLGKEYLMTSIFNPLPKFQLRHGTLIFWRSQEYPDLNPCCSSIIFIPQNI